MPPCRTNNFSDYIRRERHRLNAECEAISLNSGLEKQLTEIDREFQPIDAMKRQSQAKPPLHNRGTSYCRPSARAAVQAPGVVERSSPGQWPDPNRDLKKMGRCASRGRPCRYRAA